MVRLELSSLKRTPDSIGSDRSSESSDPMAKEIHREMSWDASEYPRTQASESV